MPPVDKLDGFVTFGPAQPLSSAPGWRRLFHDPDSPRGNLSPGRALALASPSQDRQMQKQDAEKLWSLIKSAKFAMLVTDDAGQLRGRPMAASQKEFDGTLWFFTRASSHKVSEVQDDSRVCVTYAEPSSQDYVSFSGRAALVRDRAEIDARWSELLKAWFPNGKDDSDVALLKVTVEQAEYWDSPNSKIVQIYGYAKAALTGEPPALGENRKVVV
jgi:general stress protein 26